MIKKMKYKLLNKVETEQAIIKILDVLLDSSVPYSGKHRKEQWEKGWGENLKAGDINPRYFEKHKINRLNGKFVIGFDKHYEQKMLYSIVDELAYKYLGDLEHSNSIVEFGCGTGHNLKRIRDILPFNHFIGLDWTKSSQKILLGMGMEAHNFDFFEPDIRLKLPKDSSVITVAALEQTGTRYERFLKYLIKQKPKIVIHIEPIPELLDPTKLLDYLSIKYMEKRKYLSGYLTTLRLLEKQDKIKILEARRSGVGSFLIDGYSILIWKPL